MRDYTEIVVILDRSGSMMAAKDDHEGGLKSFVEDQKQLDGDVRFTLIQFDTQNPCEVMYDGVPLDKVDHIELIPRGGTPLLDAIGKSLAHVEKRLAGKTPDMTVVMVITDGEENESREWTKTQVAARIKELEGKGWKFIYLAANVDAFAEAGSVGVASASASAFSNNRVGTQNLYASLGSNVTASRTMSQTGAGKDVSYSALDWTDDQRAAMNKEDEE